MYRGIMMHGAGLGHGLYNVNGWGHLIVLGVVLLAIAIIVWIKHKKKVTVDDKVMETLKIKFVKGEINKEEYLNRKEVLNRK